MSWIKMIAPGEAEGELQDIYARIGGQVDNVLRIHSLRPHTLSGHMALYKSVLHHRRNTLPRRLLEAVGVHVSYLNGCDYCVRHHLEGLRKLVDDPAHFESVAAALQCDQPGEPLEQAERVVLAYARRLTLEPQDLERADIEALRGHGYGDGEILEVNQVAAYFAYANRTVLGLGVSIEDEALGLAPSDADDSRNWEHR